MNYGDKIKDSQGRAAEGLLATKIIDLMDKLRLGATELSSRRWIWELLQNAKDVAYDNQPVSVIVDLNLKSGEEDIEFKHNGQPFSSDNITSLIHQVSSKKRKAAIGVKKRPTGKFGTGFLSTHLLSEKVQVKGVVKEENLPYKDFSISLDRSGTDPDEVLESVSKSLEAITVLLNSEKELSVFTPSDFNTSFTYKLQPTKVKVAEKGLGDLHISLPYTLAFSTEIEQVTVKHEGIIYTVEARNNLAKNLDVITILEDTGKGDLNKKRQIIVMSTERAAIAVEVAILNGIISLLAFEPETPKLFCDFPLVGSENFPFPVIINSPDFNINEPRNGVWLTHMEDKRVVENEAIMTEAVKLFGELLMFAGENRWQNLFELAKTKPANDSDWLSKIWFDDDILKEIRKLILFTPLILTNSGWLAIYDENGEPQIYFPDAINDNIRNEIWQLSNSSYTVPPFSDISQWSSVIWKKSLMITLTSLADFIITAENVEGLQVKLGTGVEVINWLNRFYTIMNLDSSFESDVIADKYNIIPNQNGKFLTRSELKLGRDVQNEIKDALEILGIPIRDSLISSVVSTGQNVKYFPRTEQSIIEEINTILTSTTLAVEKKYAACDYLISLVPAEDKDNDKRVKLYDFSKRIYPTTVPEKKFIKDNADVWKEADKIQLRIITKTISDSKNIGTFTTKHGFEDEVKALGFLNDFIQFLISNDLDSQLNIISKPILPNQHGEFKIKDEINLDNGELAETLKLVAEKLDYDVKSLLLDKSIYLELPDARTVTPINLANEIILKVIPATNLFPRPENIKEAFRTLLLYFIDFPDQSKKLFSDLFAHKHKLYDDEEIATNMKKAEDVKQLMEELNINSFEQMRELLTAGISSSSNNNRDEQEVLPITTEILASWGISTQEDYDRLKETDITGKIFKHYTTPTLFMLTIAEKLIARAKANIIAYLIEHPDYDTEFMEVIAPTVLAGINKAGLPIHVVFRPGDNGEVLFYFPAEKKTLDMDNAELWVDDGIVDPFHLTLGKILQTTGINRIPLYGNN